ncbi:CDP-glucose 4,6-dehydratase [Candidatus Pelagibacter sp.]|nr:CDP-glucose 4,6-dehydratase [Candidatus Pelagibacter sp.]
MKSLKNFYKNKKVLVTGATGFKGSWLCAWLLNLGSKVYATGYLPNKNNILFKSLNLSDKINLKLFDIRDLKKLDQFVKINKPQVIFHLAAQPLVIESYKKPHETFDINYRGTLNILELTRKHRFIKSVICITSDKVYENIGKIKGYKETDRLGGVDPYSASKSSTEIMVRSYRESFFKNKNICGISTVRAGNVIGGGDWSENRLIPDCINFLIKKKKIVLRNPHFSRPWQFVLEPLKGYMVLAQKQFYKPLHFSGSWNFGTQLRFSIKVIKIAELVIKSWGVGKIKILKFKKYKEQKNLQIDSTKAKKKLKWKTVYSIKKAVSVTSDWYSEVIKKRNDPLVTTFKQINEYMKKSKII